MKTTPLGQEINKQHSLLASEGAGWRSGVTKSVTLPEANKPAAAVQDREAL